MFPYSLAFAQDFTITRFHSDIIVREDSSFVVKEEIFVEFHRPRHGIYREIPFKYIDEMGRTIRTPLKVLSVTDDSGRKWRFRVSRRGNVINIRIGDPDIYLTGNQEYIITYTVKNALLYFNDHDELYWNVTGDQWRADIKQASAIVMLPTGKRSRQLWAACYTGSHGSRETACSHAEEGSTAEYITKRALRPGEGFTIAFGWDKGITMPPPAWKRFLWRVALEENWVFVLPVISLFTMSYLWFRRGRDPVKGHVMVRYEPPRFNNRPLSPAEVGCLIDERMDPRDITSSIVGLAVKGYIKIEETVKEGLILDSTDYYLSKQKEPDENIDLFEKTLMEKLFPGRSPGILVSTMKNKFYLNIDTLKDTLYRELINKGFFPRNPEKVRQFYIFVGIAIIFALSFLTIFLFPSTEFKGIIAGILSGLLVIGFSRYMPAKTITGSRAYLEVEGFKEFLNRAEKDRIIRMGDKELFSKFLPYAIALDVVDNWADAFEDVYQEPPDWYVSTGGVRAFSPGRFSSSLSSFTSSLGSAAFSSPRGSGTGSGGSGGGGFSGGGFGGGGGGSW
ncbi:MAG: DUF2207 domain-containing protein [Thermodesulfovibrionales bacterium]